MTNLPPIIKIADVAPLLGYAKETLFAMCARGDMPGAVKHGRVWSIERARFLDWYRGDGRPMEPVDVRASRLAAAVVGRASVDPFDDEE